MNKKAAVVGAGISGLYACLLLEQQGYSVDLFEKSDVIGGRLKSQKKSGFILDRGFHVMQTGYQTASKVFNYQQLGCKPFEPGALVIRPSADGAKVWRFSDPFRRPIRGLLGAFNLFTSPLNLLRVGLMRLTISRVRDEDIFLQQSQTTLDFLRSRGFSEGFIQSFFRPLFGGIFLESDLRTDSRMFHFVFKNMSRGDMVLPKDGIASCAQQLFDQLGSTKLNLGVEVAIKSERDLQFQGKTVTYDLIIKAFAEADKVETRDVWTVYFSAPKSPLKANYIMLNSAVNQQTNIISHLAVPSDIQPNYAPPGMALVAVTVVGEDAKKQSLVDADSIEQAVLKELSQWFPDEIESWNTLDVQHVKQALPECVNIGQISHDSPQLNNTCGDHTTHGSVEGALISAQLVVTESLKNAP